MREKCFGAGSPLSSSREGRRRLGEPLPHQLADNRLPAQSTHQKPRQRRGFRKHLWYRLFVSDIALPSHRSSFVAWVDESKCFGDWMAVVGLRRHAVLSLKAFPGCVFLTAVQPAFIQSQNIPCIGQRQLPASVARSHAVLALARGYSLTDRIAPGDTARLRVGVLTGH